jgi:hypothetical protein
LVIKYSSSHPESLARGGGGGGEYKASGGLEQDSDGNSNSNSKKRPKSKENSKYIHVSRQITIGMMYRSVMTARLVFRQSISR